MILERTEFNVDGKIYIHNKEDGILFCVENDVRIEYKRADHFRDYIYNIGNDKILVIDYLNDEVRLYEERI